MGIARLPWFNDERFNVSSGGLAFATHPAATGVRIINSQYWNHCRKEASFVTSKAVRKEIIEQDFQLKAPPIQIYFPWLQSPQP